jgi:transposase
MADREAWAKRVAEWKASGLSSPAYCADKDFTAGGLRHWAHRLSHGEEQAGPQVRIARVVRVRRARRPVPGDEQAEVFVEIGAARIAVRAGFDRETLAAVVDVLAAARATR